MAYVSRSEVTRPRRRVACTECRQQKARCDAGLRDDQACSRCRKFNVPCIVSHKFKRQHKHKKLSELEREAQALRTKLNDTNDDGQPSIMSPLAQQALLARVASTSSGSSRLLQTSSSSPCVHQPTEPTMTRSLCGIVLSAREIEDLFSIYFQAYGSTLPILDPNTAPNTYYAQSEFLFWVVISVACRKSSSHVHLFSTLARPVADLAFLWPTTTENPIYGIQASLLLLTWPFPRFNNTVDVTYPLAGLLMHKVKQAGFHRPSASHEFYLVAGRPAKLTEAEIASRKDLWARCVLAYQSISIAKGHLPARMFGSVGGYHTETPDRSLELQLKCQDIVVQCCTAITENGLLGTMSDDQSRAVNIIVHVFDTRLRDLEVEALTSIASRTKLGSADLPFLTITEQLMLQSARLHIEVFSLFVSHAPKPPDFEDPIALLASTARTVLDLVRRLVNTPSFPSSPPNHVVDALMIASFTILRVFKTDLGGLRMTDAEDYIDSCKHLARSLSSNENDALSKTATMLEDLWKHGNAYTKSDGTKDVPISFLGRLNAGLVIDAAWKWFDIVNAPPENVMPAPAEGACIVSSDTSQNLAPDLVQSNIVPSSAFMATGDGYPLSLFDDDIFGDFNWMMSGDDLYARWDGNFR